jgi:hypothetical protein
MADDLPRMFTLKEEKKGSFGQLPYPGALLSLYYLKYLMFSCP